MAVWAKLFSTSALLSLIRVSGAAIGFVTQIMLARLLEPAEIGLFYFLSSIAMIGGLVAAHGYPSIMARFVSRYREQGRPDRLAAFLRHAQRDTLIWSCAGALALAGAAWAWPGIETDTRIAAALCALSIAPMAIQRVYGAMANAYREFMASYLAPLFVRPLVFAIPLAIMMFAGVSANVADMAAIALAAFVAACAVQYAMMGRSARDASASKAPVNAKLSRRWYREAWPLVVVSAFTGLLSELAVLVVTPFMDFASVAAFGICLKVAFLVGFTVQVSHQVILPDLGDALARKEHGTVRSRIIGASLFPVLLTATGVLASAAFGDRLLAVFGPEFRTAQTTLTIVMAAQLVRALAGPSSILLSLKGAQTANAVICTASFVILLASSAAFASFWGAEGAAWAVVLTTVFWLAATAIALYRIDGARTDVAGLIFMSRELAAAEN